MNTKFTREKWTAELDNDAVKAIRFVLGFNTNLRVRLKNINKNSLLDWLQDNEVGIFGTDIVPRPNPTSEEWDKYECMLKDVVRQIIR